MKIYLDLHDTLIDLFSGVCKLYGYEPIALGPCAWSELFDGKVQTRIMVRNAKWWAELEHTKEASAIIELALTHAGKDNVHLLTKLSTPACAAGTLAWVQNNYPFLAERVHMCHQKEVLARHDSILIDDNVHNCEKFKSEGGMAIVVPKPWNRMYGAAGYCASYIEDELLTIVGDDHA